MAATPWQLSSSDMLDSRVSTGQIAVGGMNVPNWPFTDPLSVGGALSVKNIAVQVVGAVIVAVIVAKIMKKKGA